MPGFIVEELFGPDRVQHITSCDGLLAHPEVPKEQLLVNVGAELWIIDKQATVVGQETPEGDVEDDDDKESIFINSKLATIRVGAPALVAIPCGDHVVIVTEDLDIYTVMPQLVPFVSAASRGVDDEDEDEEEAKEAWGIQWEFASKHVNKIKEKGLEPNPFVAPKFAVHRSGQCAVVHVVGGWVHFLGLGSAEHVKIVPSRLDRHSLVDCCFLNALSSTMCFLPCFDYTDTASSSSRKVHQRGYRIEGTQLQQVNQLELNRHTFQVAVSCHSLKVIPVGPSGVVVVEPDGIVVTDQYDKSAGKAYPLHFIAVDALGINNLENESDASIALLSDDGRVFLMRVTSDADDCEDMLQCVFKPGKHAAAEDVGPITRILHHEPTQLFLESDGDIYVLDTATKNIRPVHASRGPLTAAASAPFASASVRNNWLANAKGDVFAMQSNYVLDVMAEVEGLEGISAINTVAGATSDDQQYVFLSFVSSSKVMCFGDEGLTEDVNGLSGAVIDQRTLVASRLSTSNSSALVQVVSEGLVVLDGQGQRICDKKVADMDIGTSSTISQACISNSNILISAGPLAVLMQWNEEGNELETLWTKTFDSDVATVAMSQDGTVFGVSLWEPSSVEMFSLAEDKGKKVISFEQSIATESIARALVCNDKKEIMVGLADGSVKFAVLGTSADDTTADTAGTAKLVDNFTENGKPLRFNAPAKVQRSLDTNVLVAGRQLVLLEGDGDSISDHGKRVLAPKSITTAVIIQHGGAEALIAASPNSLLLCEVSATATPSIESFELDKQHMILHMSFVDGVILALTEPRRHTTQIESCRRSTIRAYNPTTLKEISRLELEDGEVGMTLTREVKNANGGRIAILGTALVTDKSKSAEPTSGRLIALAAKPLRIVGQSTIPLGAIYSADISMVDRYGAVSTKSSSSGKSSPSSPPSSGVSPVPSGTPSSPQTTFPLSESNDNEVPSSPEQREPSAAATQNAEGDGVASWMVIATTPSHLLALSFVGDRFVESLRTPTKVCGVHVHCIQDTNMVLLGDYRWATTVYALRLVKEQLHFVEVCSEHTPSVTTCVAPLGMHIFSRCDTNRNIYVDQFLDGAIKDQIFTATKMEGKPPSSSSLVLEASCRLSSTVTGAAPFFADTPHRCKQLTLVDPNKDYQPPFPIRRVREDGASFLALNDGSVHLMSLISHELSGLLVRLQFEIVKRSSLVGKEQYAKVAKATDDNDNDKLSPTSSPTSRNPTGSGDIDPKTFWDEPSFRRGTVVPIESYFRSETSVRHLPICNTIVEGSIIRTWQHMSKVGQDDVVASMLTEFPSVTPDLISKVITGIALLS